MGRSDKTHVLTLRVPPDLARRIGREARRSRRTKSEVVREALDFIEAAADGQGWR